MSWFRGVLPALLLVCAGGAWAEDPGLEIFTRIAEPPCALCHALEAAGATGAIGPSLDELQPTREQVLEAVRTGVGVMPRFADQLSEEQIEAVTDFVVRSISGR